MPPLLTHREEEIVLLILDEHSSQDIAVLLGLSIRTVDTHRKNILKKTKSRSLVALFKFAIRQGLITEYYYKPPRPAKNT